MTAENQARLEEIRSRRTAPAVEAATPPAASPLNVDGPAVAPPPAPAPDASGMAADASRMQAARESQQNAAAASAVTDNSTWNVHINSRSEKELQDAMLKMLVKHQQRLAN